MFKFALGKLQEMVRDREAWSLISWHSYIGIPINFHEESGIVTF